MDLGLGGKHVVVTGGSRGIGRGIAASFLAEGARVTLVARDPAALHAAREKLVSGGAPSDAIGILVADLSSDAGRAHCAAACATPDILVNNAGAIRGGNLAALGMDDWRSGWELKVFGYIHMCKLVLPAMRARGSGAIINIIGMGGRAVRPTYICGAAGNAALIGFTNALGAENTRDGVRVFGINPSPTLTDRMERLYRDRAASELGSEERWQELVAASPFPFGRPAAPSEIGDLAVMLASGRVAYLSGTVVDVDGGAQWLG